MVANMSAFYISLQPERPLGPLPIFVWLSDVLVGFAALYLGHEVTQRTSRTDQLSLLVAQLGCIGFMLTFGMLAGYIADPDWWESSVILTLYFQAYMIGTPILVVYHIIYAYRQRTNTQNPV